MDGRQGTAPSAPRPLLGLRDRKKEQTRRNLREAALRLFTEKGFGNVTVDDITAEVDVSHRTFYRYFSSKEEIILGTRSVMLDRWVTAIERRPSSEPLLVAVQLAAVEVATHMEPEVFDRRRIEVLEDTPALKARAAERLAAWEEVLAPVVARRLDVDVDADLRPRLISGCMIVALRVAQTRWLALDGDLPTLVAQTLELLSRDFGTRV